MVVKAVVVTGARIVNFDAGGIGWAMGTVIRQALKDAKVLGVQLNPINFGAASREPEKYANKRAEMVWGIGRIFTGAMTVLRAPFRLLGNLVGKAVGRAEVPNRPELPVLEEGLTGWIDLTRDVCIYAMLASTLLSGLQYLWRAVAVLNSENYTP